MRVSISQGDTTYFPPKLSTKFGASQSGAWDPKAIVKSMGISRNTVRKYLFHFQTLTPISSEVQRPSRFLPRSDPRVVPCLQRTLSCCTLQDSEWTRGVDQTATTKKVLAAIAYPRATRQRNDSALQSASQWWNANWLQLRWSHNRRKWAWCRKPAQTCAEEPEKVGKYRRLKADR